MQEDVASTISPAQRLFAEAHHARAGMVAATGAGVFFYRSAGETVDRWLVDRQGSVLDEAHFHMHPA